MTTITKGAVTITPDLVLGYQATTESTNVVHQLVGGGIAVTLGNDNPRAGTLELFFLTRAGAWAAHALHASAGIFTLADAELPEIAMIYVREGSMEVSLDDNRVRWLLSVGYQEVLS